MGSNHPRDEERRLTALKVGAVGITVAGLGVFAGLAAAGTDDPPLPISPAAATASPDQSAAEAARIAEDDAFFDDQAQGGAVGDYEGYGDGDGGGYGERGHHRDHHGHHGDDRYRGTGPGGHSGEGGPGSGGGDGYAAPQGGYAPSQGSTGGS